MTSKVQQMDYEGRKEKDKTMYDDYFFVSKALLDHWETCHYINNLIDEVYPSLLRIGNMLSAHRADVASALIKSAKDPHDYLGMLPDAEVIAKQTHCLEYMESIKKILKEMESPLAKLKMDLKGVDLKLSPYNQHTDNDYVQV